jgi:hypothetical protein
VNEIAYGFNQEQIEEYGLDAVRDAYRKLAATKGIDFVRGQLEPEDFALMFPKGESDG